MKLLATIRNEDLGFKPHAIKKYKEREASRAVLLNSEGKIALLFVSKEKYHKLPGGGIKKGEDIESALKREVLEETGCSIKKGRAIGKIVEYRDDFFQKQTSYCYLAKVEKAGKPKFTNKESSLGFKLKWVGSALEWLSLDSAISLLKNDRPLCYEGRFIVERDRIFLEAAGILSLA